MQLREHSRGPAVLSGRSGSSVRSFSFPSAAWSHFVPQTALGRDSPHPYLTLGSPCVGGGGDISPGSQTKGPHLCLAGRRAVSDPRGRHAGSASCFPCPSTFFPFPVFPHVASL